MEKGIKETTEALVACVLVGKLVMKKLSDGAQVSDALEVAKELLTNEELRNSIMAGVAGSTEILAEVKDLDLEEALELIEKLVVEFTK
jgi:urease gamma subunit